jgi:hypothetical protein
LQTTFITNKIKKQDLEEADLALEKRELELHPEEELQELAAIYEVRNNKTKFSKT